jgi:hypothetical protein
LEIVFAVVTSGGRMRRRRSSSETRETAEETLSAAIVSGPRRIGAATERRPISSSWSTSAQPRWRVSSRAARRRSGSVVVRSVQASSLAPFR